MHWLWARPFGPPTATPTRTHTACLTVDDRLRPCAYASASVPSFESGPTRAHEAGSAHVQAARMVDGSNDMSAPVVAAAAAAHEGHGWYAVTGSILPMPAPVPVAVPVAAPPAEENCAFSAERSCSSSCAKRSRFEHKARPSDCHHAAASAFIACRIIVTHLTNSMPSGVSCAWFCERG